MHHLSPAQALEKLAAPGTILIDVRSPAEFASGHAASAVNMPMNTLTATGTVGLKQFSEICVICQTGHRSAIATVQLLSLGFKAWNVVGGTEAWERYNGGLA